MAFSQIFHDTFTEGVLTNLESHTPDVGTGWTKLQGSTGNITIRAADDQWRLAVISEKGIYVISDACAATQRAEAQIIASTSLGSFGFGANFQLISGELSGYLCWRGSTNTIRLHRIVSGAATQIDSYDAGVSTIGYYARVTIDPAAQTAQLSWSTDGSSWTDRTAISEGASYVSGGKPGLYNNIGAVNTIGDNFRAYEDAGGAAVAAFVAHRSFLGFPP